MPRISRSATAPDGHPGPLSPWHAANLALAFLLELCALTALAYWGAHTGHGPGQRFVLAAGAPLSAAVLWGLFASPRARPAPRIVRPAVRALVHGCAVTGLWSTGQHVPAAVLAALVVGNGLALGPLRHRPADG